MIMNVLCFLLAVDPWEQTRPQEAEQPQVVMNSSTGLRVVQHKQMARHLSQTLSISNLG